MERLAGIVWGVPAMVLLLVVGAILTVQTRFVQLRKFGSSMVQTIRSVGNEGRSSYRAICTALAGTVGTGNVAGVAGAVAMGGPGAVFWMWVAAFFGMATKYAEVVLAMRYRRRSVDGRWQGGAMYTIVNGMGARWKPLAAVFAFGAVLVSLGMGNLAQIHTMTAAVCFGYPKLPAQAVSVGLGVTAALLCMATAGGAGRIGAVVELLVPVAAGLYILGAAAVLVTYRNKLGPAFGTILQGAFCPEAVLGGGAGIGIRQALRWGVSRGVFSNEAGLGSAPMAHISAEAAPEVQGLFGIFEVFLDTIVLCTLTALVILVSGISVPWGSDAGSELAAEALKQVFGESGSRALAWCLGLLAIGSMMTWQLYGVQCTRYLWGWKGERVFRWIYPVVTILGTSIDVSFVWAFSDLCNGLMCLPNLLALLVLRKKVRVKSSCKTG